MHDTYTLQLNKTYCGTTEAASLLGLSVSSVCALADVNLLKAWRTKGGHRRIYIESIFEYKNKVLVGDYKVKNSILIVEDPSGDIANRCCDFFKKIGSNLKFLSAREQIEVQQRIALCAPFLVIIDMAAKKLWSCDVNDIISDIVEYYEIHVILIFDETPTFGPLSQLNAERVHVVNGLLSLRWLSGFIFGLTGGYRA